MSYVIRDAMCVEKPDTVVAQLDELDAMADPAEPPSKGFHANSSGDITFNYKAIPELPKDVRKALSKYDVDGNGDVSLSELLHMSKSRDQLKKQVCFLVVLVLGLLAVLFGVSFVAASLAQKTDSNGDSLTAPNSDMILKTADPKQTVPIAFSSLLDKANLARVTEVVISNLATRASDKSVPTMCTTCPKDTIMQVSMTRKYDDTHVEYLGTGNPPTVVDIKKGLITVKNLPGFDPDQVFEACGSATCSTISVSGVDVQSLKERATELGFVATAGNRRHPTDGSIRRASKSSGCFATNEPGCSNVKDWTFTHATVTQNNLGGVGPDTADTQEIRYSGVADGIDLILTTNKPYAVNPKIKDYDGRMLDGAGNNGMNGKFGIVNVKGGTSVDMTFTLVEADTDTPVEIDPGQTVFFSVFDLDANRATNKGKAFEFVKFTTPVDSYAVSDSTTVKLSGNNNNLYARSGRYGSEDDNPTNPLEMTQLQKDSAVSITYKGRNTWGMTFGEGNNPGKKAGRNLMFAGRSEDDCPPGPLAPPPGACDRETKGIEGVIKGGGRVCCPDACGGPRSPDAPYACGGPQCDKGPDGKRDAFRYANCCVGKPVEGGTDKSTITAPYGILNQHRFCSWGVGKGGLGGDAPPCTNKLPRVSDRL